MKGRMLLIFATAFLFPENRACSLEVPKEVATRLAAEGFQSRESAQEELLQWGRKKGEPARKALLLQARMADDPEVRQRCRDVVWQLVIEDYLKDGQGYVGILMEERLVKIPGMAEPQYGIDIGFVVPLSPAEEAGLIKADTIVGLGDLIWKEPGASRLFAAKVQSLKPSTRVTLKVLRGEKMLDIPLILGRKPPGQQGQGQNPEAADRAAKEAYFRDWMAKQKLPE